MITTSYSTYCEMHPQPTPSTPLLQEHLPSYQFYNVVTTWRIRILLWHDYILHRLSADRLGCIVLDACKVSWEDRDARCCRVSVVSVFLCFVSDACAVENTRCTHHAAQRPSSSPNLLVLSLLWSSCWFHSVSVCWLRKVHAAAFVLAVFRCLVVAVTCFLFRACTRVLYHIPVYGLTPEPIFCWLWGLDQPLTRGYLCVPWVWPQAGVGF